MTINELLSQTILQAGYNPPDVVGENGQTILQRIEAAFHGVLDEIDAEIGE